MVNNATKINDLILNSYGILLVTCPKCGAILSQKEKAIEYTCNVCGESDEPCHFPDFFY